MKRKEEMELLRQQLSDANADINQTNKSLENLAKVENEYKKEEKNEPILRNYYTPSKEMKEYQNIAIFAGGLASGYLGYKIYEKMSY